MKINIDIINRQRKIKISSKRLSIILKRIIKTLYLSGEFQKFKSEKYSVITVSLVLIGRKKMKEINFKYRGKNYVTDVLAFPYLEKVSPLNELYLGEILISLEKAKSQAMQYGVSMWQEINRLLVHGILHLLGYDHEKSSSHARKMRKMEEKILKNL